MIVFLAMATLCLEAPLENFKTKSRSEIPSHLDISEISVIMLIFHCAISPALTHDLISYCLKIEIVFSK